MSLSNDASNLLTLLQHGPSHREVYTAKDGSWWVTYGGGPAKSEAVQELIREGLIVRCYDTCNGIYHCGKTLDTKATSQKQAGKRLKERLGIRVYTDGTTSPPPTAK